MSGSTSLVSMLDPLPEDVIALDADGCTPLHHAAASSKYDVVKFLASRANGRVSAYDSVVLCCFQWVGFFYVVGCRRSYSLFVCFVFFVLWCLVGIV